MRRPGALARPVGFLLLMVGFGLRLDTGWQVLASVLLGVGAFSAGVGLWGLTRGRPARTLSSAPVPGDNAPSARGGQTGGTDCVPRSA